MNLFLKYSEYKLLLENNTKFDINTRIKIIEPEGGYFYDENIKSFYGSTGTIKEILRDGGETLYYVELDKIVTVNDNDIIGDYFTQKFLKEE